MWKSHSRFMYVKVILGKKAATLTKCFFFLRRCMYAMDMCLWNCGWLVWNIMFVKKKKERDVASGNNFPSGWFQSLSVFSRVSTTTLGCCYSCSLRSPLLPSLPVSLSPGYNRHGGLGLKYRAAYRVFLQYGGVPARKSVEAGWRHVSLNLVP